MRTCALGMVLAALAFAATGELQNADGSYTLPTNSFDGWEGNLDWFRIEGDTIVAGSLEKPIPTNQFLCTKETYENFELNLQVKLVDGKGNAGIQFRSARIPDHHEVKGYQADMGQIYWGSLYDESRRNTILAKADPDVIERILKKDDWNHYRIRAEGPRIQLWLNGVRTVDYTEEDDGIARDGIIGLQIHGGAPAEAHYKEISILPLP